MTIAQQIVHGLIKRFPLAGALTLGKKAYRENKEVWPTQQAAYMAVRRALGVAGRFHRKCDIDYGLRREPREAGEGFERLPEPLKHFDDWKAFKVDGPFRALVISDVHVPYFHREALIVALEHGQKAGADLVLLNGDLADFHAMSDFEKDPRKRNLKLEFNMMREVLAILRDEFPKARIIYKEGNHEERYERYMMKKSPDFLETKDFQMEPVFRMPELKIEYVKDRRPIMLGKLNVIHGHEFSRTFAPPVNPARGFFLKGKAHCLGGHHHQTSQHSEKNIEQLVVSTWSTGCLCDLHPDYAPINQWNHGFAMVDVDKDGGFLVNNLRVVNGKVY